MAGAERVHATAIALNGYAALIRGASGAGKSDLALRCMMSPPTPLVSWQAMLVSDDQVDITMTGHGLDVSAPAAIHGKLEVRGLGIITVPAVTARLGLVVDLAHPSEIARYPMDLERVLILDQPVPLIRLAPFELSAAHKLLIALCRAQHTRDVQQ